MSTWTTEPEESKIVRALGEIVMARTHDSADRRMLEQDVKELQENYDENGTITLSPEFRYWESRAQALTGLWWECSDDDVMFTIHY